MPRYNPHKAYRKTAHRHKYMPYTGCKCEDFPCCGHVEGHCPEPKTERGEIPTPATGGSGVPILTENQEKDGYELKFPGKPSEAVLALFRETKTLSSEARWHWHFKKKVWYAKRNDATREFAQLVISQSSGLPKAEPIPVVEVVPAAVAVEAVAPEPEKQVPSAPPAFAGGGDPIPLNVEHSAFPRPMWALEVQDGGTRLAYDEWVEAKMALACEQAAEPEPEEVETPLPENVVLASFTPPGPVQIEAERNQSSPVPDWRARFSWSDVQRRRERGQLPGQRNYKG